MIAVHATAFGDPSVLTTTELPDVEPGPGEVAIDVSHAAVGLVDVLMRRGELKDVPGTAQPPFVPGLEVAGTVRALGPGVSGLAVGVPVVAMSGRGTGGYASVYVAPAQRVVPIERGGVSLDPALAVSTVPNAAMAHVALTQVAHLAPGESVLVHGALGGLAAAFPGTARRLGAGRVVGTVRPGRLDAAASTRLPYDAVVDSTRLADELAGQTFDVVIDPVGGPLRTQSLDLLRPGGRLVVAGNAGGDWGHQVDTNQLWLRSITVAGFNSGAYLPTRPELLTPALEAAVAVVADGLADTVVETLPLEQAAEAHRRMEDRTVDGRLVLTPGTHA